MKTEDWPSYRLIAHFLVKCSMLIEVVIPLVFWPVVMLIGWCVQEKTKDSSHVDVLWSLGLGLMAIYWSLTLSANESRGVILACLGGIWGVRLSSYLFFNRVLGKPEDSRYRQFREKWGPEASKKFFWFFQIQAVLIILFSLPFLAVALNPSPLQIFDFVGIALWVLAVGGESIADKQLSGFLSKPENKGKLFKGGLWQYSRHPNYFCEWLHWFAYMALAVGSAFWYLSVLGPLLMWVFLQKITGIPIIEKRALERRGQEYREYMKETNRFFPWFPKKP